MQKIQLSNEKIEAVELLINQLDQAGWETDDWYKKFKQGKDVFPEVTFRLKTDLSLLGLTYFPEKNCISLMVAAKDNMLKYVEFRFYYSNQEQLLAALNLITAQQKSLSIENYCQLVEKLLDICPDIYWEIQGTEDEQVTKNNLKEGHPRMKMTFK